VPDQHAEHLPRRQVRGQVELGTGRDLVPNNAACSVASLVQPIDRSSAT
jgi:hypothetical protein